MIYFIVMGCVLFHSDGTTSGSLVDKWVMGVAGGVRGYRELQLGEEVHVTVKIYLWWWDEWSIYSEGTSSDDEDSERTVVVV